MKSEVWLSSIEPAAYNIYQAAERIEPAIIMELWLREMFSGPECGPCYVLDGADCELYIRYFDAGTGGFRGFTLIFAMTAGLTSSLVFYYLARKQ